MVERIRFIKHAGRDILLLDFSNFNADDFFEAIDFAKDVIASQPEKSLLTLTDVTGARFDKYVTMELKEFASHNHPYVKAAAVVGVKGLKEVILNTIMLFSERKFHAFDSIEDAKEWLTKN